ncbi:hypothetical protein M3I01_002285 [Marinomonas sp. RSW2]|uniref:Uncharacterized protein n=1 Tax=Marinomonas maritima TaxID=2940935 RepID=A0ABT5WAM6_9GAMM|nr:hypothetical protein [Marinomonas maritima]MDE8601757.1 hypothetical protein [Marinomonas maritima]
MSHLSSKFRSANADPKTPGTHKGYSTIDMTTAGMPSDVKMISMADIKKERQDKAPFVVGFDIDGTTLFSTPVFYRGPTRVLTQWLFLFRESRLLG